MAKLQRWKRRDRPATGTDERSDEAPVEASGAPSGGVRVEVAEEADPGVVDEAPAVATEPEVTLATGSPAARTDAGTGVRTAAGGVPRSTGASDDDVAWPDERTAPTRGGRLLRAVLDSGPVLLLVSSHPRQALVTGAGLGLAALASDRPLREAAVVAATGLVGQAVLGWHNDVVDRSRDQRHRTPRKPLADGRLDVGSAWFAMVVAVLLVIPLSISTGVTAGTFYLGALAVGLLGNVVLRRGKLSFVSWAAQFALYVPYLSHGGWGGSAEGSPPEVVMVVLAALLGVGVHVIRAIWGLVADDADRWTYLPLVLGRRLGASRLLAVAAAFTVAVLVAIVVVGGDVGLRR